MTPRGLGHVLDTPDDRDFSATALVGDVVIPSSLDYSRFVDHVRDQQSTGSCVGQAFARALHIRAAIAGTPIPFPSALGIYATARTDERPMVDMGCRPRDALIGMQSFGVVAEDRWPFDETRVNVGLPWDAFQHGADARVDSYYRVMGDGDYRCTMVRAALANGFPVAFAQLVDAAMDSYTDGVLGPVEGATRGSHMTTIVGYQPGSFLACNSWGEGWGRLGGLYRLSDARIGSSATSDFYAVTVAPGGVS